MTTYTDPHSLPIIEPNSDKIKDGAEASALAGDINALAMAANAAISAEGVRSQQGAVEQVNGILASYQKTARGISAGSDMNTYYGTAYQGQYYVSSTQTAQQIANMPTNRLGAVATTAFQMFPLYGTQIAYIYTQDQAPTIKYRGRTTFDNTLVNAWSEWQEIGAKSTALTNVMQDNKSHVDAFMRARGGALGTGSVAAVALRFDHNMANFRDIILPLLRARNLPWSLAVNTSQNHIDAPANGGVTWAQLQGWALNDGGEVLAHSHNHADSTSDEAIIANVEDSIPILKAGMPEIVVEGFAVPGAGGTNWNGFLDTTTPEHFSTKYTGASAVLKNFAFCTGYIPGALRPMMGQLNNGQTHVTMDNYTVSSTAINTLQQAQQMGAGVQLMMHPNMLTLAGKITTSVLTEILDWIVAERDAGRLVVLTTSGLLMADGGRSYRNNILRGFGTSVWSSTTGWTVSGTTATGTTSAGIMSGSVSLANLGHVTGRVRELVVQARSAAGAVMRIGLTGSTSLSVSKDFTIPADNTWRTYRIPASLPNSATTLTATLGRVSGGAMEMRDPALQAV